MASDPLQTTDAARIRWDCDQMDAELDEHMAAENNRLRAALETACAAVAQLLDPSLDAEMEAIMKEFAHESVRRRLGI